MKLGKDSHTLAWLNDVARGKRRWIILLTALQSVLGVTGVCNALLLRRIVDSAVSGDGAAMRCFSFALIGLVLLNAGLRASFRYLEERTRADMENSLKARLFYGLLTRDYGVVTATHSGEWMNRLTSDVVIVGDGITQIIPGLAGTCIRIVAALLALLMLQPEFGLVFLGGGVFLVLLTVFMRKRLKSLHRSVQTADGELRVFLSERLGSMMTIRAFGREGQTLSRAKEHMQRHRKERLRRVSFSNFCGTGMNLMMNGSYTLGAIFCGSRILAGKMSYGTLTAMLQLIGQAQTPVANISGYLPKYYSMLASAERLMEVEALEQENTDSAVDDIQTFYREDFQGLALRGVSFAYKRDGESLRVLNQMDLLIRKGEYVAFTGPSGCGKSTVLKLLMSLFSLDGGEKLVLTKEGEQPLNASWRGLFSYVPQGNQLMNGTIRDVLTFGEPEERVDQRRLRQALEIACADEFVGALKEGLDTPLGERGAGLSEGQMQRIAIARAIYSGRPILLLDEATSALDEITEKKVLQNLRRMTDQTVIIVTHRPAVLDVTDQEIRFRKNEA